MISRMHSTPVYVRDQKAALAFSTGTLGFRVVDDTPMGDQRWIVVAPQDADRGISLQLSDGMGQRDTPATIGGHTGISFVREDVQRLYDDLTAGRAWCPTASLNRCRGAARACTSPTRTETGSSSPVPDFPAHGMTRIHLGGERAAQMYSS